MFDKTASLGGGKFFLFFFYLTFQTTSGPLSVTVLSINDGWSYGTVS